MKNIADYFLLLLLTLVISCSGGSNSGEAKSEDSKSETPAMPEFSLTDEMSVGFVNLEDGAEVTSPFNMAMEVSGMEMQPAGTYGANKGHHHLVINGSSIEMYEIVPADDNNIHYGDARTETEVILSPGEHTLTLQFADGFHRSYGEQLSATISVVVVD